MDGQGDLEPTPPACAASAREGFGQGGPRGRGRGHRYRSRNTAVCPRSSQRVRVPNANTVIGAVTAAALGSGRGV